MLRVYVSHKYGGDNENKLKVEEIIRELVRLDDDLLFISPIHNSGFLYYDVSYEHGMEMCFDLLRICDVMVVCSEDSKGVKLEREFCEEYQIPVYELEDFKCKINEWVNIKGE